MASIQTKGKTHYVVISKKNPCTGKYDSDWIPFPSYEDAEAFKDAVNDKKKTETERTKNITDATRTLEELIWQYVELVGKVKWGVNTYPIYISRIENYIVPLIKGWTVWECTTLKMDEFFTRLQKMKAIRQTKKISEKLVSIKIVQEVHKFMRAMFNCAEEWGYIKKNPCQKTNRSIVKHVSQKRPFWRKDTYMDAVRCCAKSEDFLLLTAMVLAVGTSAREGEICGLQWDRCYISDKEIADGSCRVFIDREVMRAKKYMVNQKSQDILYVFPDVIKSSTSSLVLKEPKSDTSNRTIWLPKTVAKFLRVLKEQQNAQKEFLGNAYQDHNLVFALDDGRPMENKVLYNRFAKFVSKNNLPQVVFHSIRHTSTTYMLKTTQGDVKSVQGNTGHATLQMVMDTYAEIIDQDRMVHAQTFERDFFDSGSLLNAFSGTNNDLLYEVPEELQNKDVVKVLHLLQNDPQLMNQLLSMVHAS